jgi:hypothetical protein
MCWGEAHRGLVASLQTATLSLTCRSLGRVPTHFMNTHTHAPDVQACRLLMVAADWGK